jgi:hypothetical protein
MRQGRRAGDARVLHVRRNLPVERVEGAALVADRHPVRVDVGALAARRIAVPDDAKFVAAGRLAGDAHDSLLLLGTQGVSAVDPRSGAVRLLVEAQSIYRAVDRKRLRAHRFVHDITGNGLADFLIPDFHAYRAYVQRDSGEFDLFTLPVGADGRVIDEMANYVPRTPFIVDFTGDGRPDVLFVRDGRFEVFHQHARGRLREAPLLYATGVFLTPDLEADVRPGDGRDFAGLVLHSVHALEDLNGDGVPDLVVRRQHHHDGIEQHESYRVHYGRRSDDRLSFGEEPDAHIETTGMQLDPIFVDVNGNGRRDFGTATATLGIGTIIRALLTGASSMDVLFFAMDEDGRFRGEPDYRQSARVEVSMRNRQVDMPLLRVADLHGDGRKSLLVSEGRDVLWVYRGQPSGLFARRGERVRVTLPRETANVLVADLTGNGRDDLVLPFGPRDDPDRPRLELLISR